MSSNLPALLFLVPFASALVIVALGGRRPRLLGWIAAGSMLLTAALSVWAALRVAREGTLVTHFGGWAPPVGIEWMLDPFSSLMALLVGVGGALVVIGSAGTVERELRGREGLYHGCALLLVSGLMGMALTHDLFNLFVMLELSSLASYALVACGPRRAPAAAIDYLVLGSIGATLYLLGVGFLYAATGTLNMDDVAQRLAMADPRLATSGLALILVGLGVKMGLFPLHTWMPAAYSTAPSAAGSLMAPLATKVAAYALLRVLYWVFRPEALHQQELLLEVLCWAGAAAMVWGGVRAAMQRDLLRLLAFSSVSQMGLVALGAGLANADGLTGALLHIANDTLMKGALFLAAGAALVRFGVRRVDELGRLRGRAPFTSGVFVVAGLSLVGIPPLSGFYGKWYVLQGAVEAQRWGLAAAIVLATLATAFYVFRLVEQIFFAPSGSAADSAARPASATSVMLAGAGVLFAVGIVLAGVFNEPLVRDWIRPALPGGL